jgi:hypothetical protein
MPRVLSLVLACLSACSAAPGPAPAPVVVPAVSHEDDVREAVLRHLIAQERDRKGSKAFCVAFWDDRGEGPTGGGPVFDPGPAFLVRLADVDPPVRPRSSCTGLGLAVGDVVVHDDDATATGSYHAGALDAAGYTYTLHRDASGWVVTGNAMQWIS